MSNILKDFPEFIAIFEKILQDGFFTNTQFGNTSVMEGSTSIRISLSGNIPTNEKHKKAGTTPFFDSHILKEMLTRIKHHPDNIIVFSNLELKNSDWLLYDTEGENVIGSKGREYYVNLIISLKKG